MHSVLVIILCGALIGCADGLPPLALYAHLEPSVEVVSPVSFNGATDQFVRVIRNDHPRTRTYDFSIESETSPIWRLYFVFSNSNDTVVEVPKLTILNMPEGASVGSEIRSLASDSVSSSRRRNGNENDLSFLDINTVHPVLPDVILPSLDERDARDSRDVRDSRSASTQRTNELRDVPAPPDEVGDEETFYLPGDDAMERIRATARYIATQGAQRVVFWLPDNVYVGCNNDCLPTLIEQADVERLATQFIRDDADDDIYDTMRALLGPHWGPRDSNSYIPATQTQIDILLYDIENSGYAPEVSGYYWRGNNILTSAPGNSPNSNERLMMYLHAPWLRMDFAYLSEASGISFQPDLQSLRERFYYYTALTLIHEFQHMIHFYQRGIDPDTRDDVWLNEQFSLITEDLLSQILFENSADARDDRGLPRLDAGSYPICLGRVRHFSSTSSNGVSQWGSNRLLNYSTQFLFGAHLLRNYGGVNYLRNAYQSVRRNADAISDGISAGNPGLFMSDAVEQWGVALLLSDLNDRNPPLGSGYQSNNRPGFRSTFGGREYTLGSINYYNYATCNRNNTTGSLRVFSDTEIAYYNLANRQDGHSNIIVAAAENFDGEGTFKVTLQSGQSLVVVAKRTPTRNTPSFFRSP